MSIFRPAPPDPTQRLISELISERDHYKARVQELEEKLIAITSAQAHRLIYGQSPIPSTTQPEALPTDVFAQRSTTYVPDHTLADIQRRNGEIE